MIAGPKFGTCLSPVTFGRNKSIRIGVKNDFRKVYAIDRRLHLYSGETLWSNIMVKLVKGEGTNLGVNGLSVTPSGRGADTKLGKFLSFRG